MLCLLLSCSEEKSDIIPPDEMEEILFDYHLTQGLIDVQPPEDYTHNQRYLDAVFSNHGVTEAQFDSSMIYYTREALKLRDIYANISRRYKEMEDALKMQAGNENAFIGLTASGDTANVWSAGSTIVLRPMPLQNKLIFTIKNDSTLFLRRDKLRLMANAAFYREISDDRNCYVELGITLEYRNGKTVGANRMINTNSPIELDLDAASVPSTASSTTQAAIPCATSPSSPTSPSYASTTKTFRHHRHPLLPTPSRPTA